LTTLEKTKFWKKLYSGCVSKTSKHRKKEWSKSWLQSLLAQEDFLTIKNVQLFKMCENREELSFFSLTITTNPYGSSNPKFDTDTDENYVQSEMILFEICLSVLK